MAGTQNSISSMLAQFLRLQKNSLEILNGLNEAAISTNNTVTIEVLDEAGLPKNANIPSYGYIRGEIQRIDSNIQAMAGLGNNSATIRNPDGTYSQIFKSETLKEPPTLSGLPVPSTFFIRDNWFFESFLSPLLYININVTGKISDSSDRIKVIRVIANTDTDDKRSFFDSNLKGRNDLTYEQYINTLEGAGIGYFTDEDVIDLPLRTLRFIGNFGVTSYYDDIVTVTNQNANQVETNDPLNVSSSYQETRRNYKLTTLNYTDTLSNVKDGRTLDIGDRISTPDGTLYQVTAVNVDQGSIQAKRLSGYEPIKLGANTIQIASTDFGPRYAQVNIGYNERQGIFFKTIDDNFNIVGSTWSTGVILWTNDLITKNPDGEVVSLEQYYLSDVSDIGKILLGMAKDKTVPAVQGLIPDVPLVVPDNFKVVQINKQVTESTSVKVINDKLQVKSTLRSEINSLDDAINNTKIQLNTGLATSNQQNSRAASLLSRLSGINPIDIPSSEGSLAQTNNRIGVNTNSLQADLSNLIDERVKKVSLYSSIVDEVSTLSQDVPQVLEPPKYRVRGFWAIPSPKLSPATGEQAVIQFSVRYRYLTDSGSAQPSEQIEYLDVDNVKKIGAFSNWIEYKTDIRKKVYDPNTGFYVWTLEVTADSNVQNINQLDIPITKGEKVEIQIASISEAGWPNNPLTSEYSTSVVISFPDNLTVTGSAELIKTNNEDSAVVKVQANLNAQGLPLHLSEQFTAGDRTYYHTAVGISSGFYSAAGSALSLYDKLIDLQNQLNQLKASVSAAVGVLEVYLVDSSGNKVKATRGTTISLNAGFYADFFSAPLTNDAGKVASVIYSIQLVNIEASALELASSIPGGLQTAAPTFIGTNNPQGYNTNLRYSDGPISVTSLTRPQIVSNQEIRQAPPFASQNAFSQYIYPRYKNVGFDQILLNNPNPPSGVENLASNFTAIYSSTYSYDGVSSSTQQNFGVSGIYPQNGTIFTPYDPTLYSNYSSVIGGTAANVWNGTFTGVTGGDPVGGGFISEFCIDKRHPYLVEVGTTTTFTTYSDLVKPFASSGVSYAPFRHTQSFWGDTSLNVNYVQQAFRTPLSFPSASTDPREDDMYSDKLGFSSNDEYLIGKFSCGSYLFLAPSSGDLLQVSGTTSLSYRTLLGGETNAINIPMVFQFRCVDKAGYIGGFRKSGNLTNINYTKKIGIDVQVANSDIFSFDIIVSGGYQNDTLVAPNFSGGTRSLFV